MRNGSSKAAQDPDGAAVERTEEVAGATTAAAAGYEGLALTLPSVAWLLVAAASLSAELKTLSLVAPELDAMARQEFLSKPVSVTAVEQALGYRPSQKRLDRLVAGVPPFGRPLVWVDVCRLQLSLAHARKQAPSPNEFSLAQTVTLLLHTSFPDCTIGHCAFFLRRSRAANRAQALKKLADVDIAEFFSAIRDTWTECLWGSLCVSSVLKLLLLLALRAGLPDAMKLPNDHAAVLAGALLETFHPLDEPLGEDNAEVADEPGEGDSAESEEDLRP